MTAIRALCRPAGRFSWLSVVLAAVLLTIPPFSPDAHAARQAEPLVVVELFTSQGCSSCPPADAFLGELSERKGLLALSLHVDYWNYMGWKDPFSSAQMTQRQRAYASKLGQRYVYTPQMVIDGAAQGEGGARSQIEALLVEARKRIDEKLPIRIARGGTNEMKVVLPAAKPKARDKVKKKSATLWLVAYDDQHSTEIIHGENRGRTLNYRNVVRSLKPVATWDGKATEVVINLAQEIAAGYDNYAVLLQIGEAGPILAAAKLPMPTTAAGVGGN